MNRRQFLKMIGLGALGAAALPIKQEPMVGVDYAKGSDKTVVQVLSWDDIKTRWVPTYNPNMLESEYLRLHLNNWNEFREDLLREWAATK